MALPTTISGVQFPLQNNFLGPFLSSGGNVYVVVLDTTSSRLHVYKATDPTSSFSEQDSAHIPTEVTANTVWVIQNGDVLSIAGWVNNSNNPSQYYFHQFSLATDLWSSTIINKLIAGMYLANTANASVSIVKRSDGSFVALMTGQREQVMGTSYERVRYSVSTDGGSTWSAFVEVDSASGAQRDAIGGIAVLGASDRTHFFYSDTTSNLKHKSLSSANVLDTEAAVVTVGTAMGHNACPGVSYVSGANTVVKVPVNSATAGRLSNCWLNSGANPTINVESNYSDATVKAVNSQPIVCHALDGTKIYSEFSDATNQHLKQDSETDGGSWGTDVDKWTATINRVSSNIYTRSGSKVLAVIVDDGGTIKYNEFAIVAAANAATITMVTKQAISRAAVI